LAVAAIGAVVLAAGTGADSNPVRPAFAPRADAAPRHEPPSRAISPTARAERLVRSYYAAIDAGHFAAAWARLSPAVRTRFGGFAVWRAGYTTTLDQRVEAVKFDGPQIRHILVARDRTPCGGTVAQRFAVVWTMAHGRAAALHAVRLAGQDPAAAC
jgi:hypothetical protein